MVVPHHRLVGALEAIVLLADRLAARLVEDVQAVVSYHLAVFVVRMLTVQEAAQAQGQVYEAAYLIRSLEPRKEASLREGS